MFFKEKQCEKCGKYYDEMQDFCPSCLEENSLYKDEKKKHQMLWLPIKDQLFNFLIGFFGLNIITIIVTIFLAGVYNNNQPLGLMLINTISYVLVFIGLLAYNFSCHLKGYFIKYFKDKEAYLFGIFMAVVLLTLSTLCSIFADGLFPNQVGGNQNAAVDLVNSYPVISLLVLGFLGPIVEELTYRVGLFNFMARTKRWIAYLVEVLVFALLHFDFSGNLLLELANLPAYLVAGLVLTYTYEKKGPAASMTAHIINNVFSVITIILAVKL